MLNLDMYSILKELIVSYNESIVFFIILILGENGVFLTTIFANTNIISYETIFLLGILAMSVTDILWFLVPKNIYFNKIINSKRIPQKFLNIKPRLDQITHNKDISLLIISKILIGTRIIIIIYLSSKGMNTVKFVLSTLIINVFWVGFLVGVVLFIGGSYQSIVNNFNSIQIALLISFISIIIFNYILYKIGKWILKK